MFTRRARSDRGAAAVEFALVVPLVAMLLIGTFTVALAYSDHVALTNAVREGARLGSTLPETGSWGSSVQAQTVAVYSNANNPLVAGDVCAAMYKKASDGTINPVTTTGNITGCPGEPSAPTGIPAGCFVKVWASHDTQLNWVLGSSTRNLRAQSVSIYDRGQSC